MMSVDFFYAFNERQFMWPFSLMDDTCESFFSHDVMVFEDED